MTTNDETEANTPESNSAKGDRNGNQAAPEASSVKGKLIEGLLEDVRMLTMHAVETGQLPEGVDVQEIFQAIHDWENTKEIEASQFAKLVDYYQILEHYFPRITAHSLQATEPEVPGKIQTSLAGRYLRKLWIYTGLVVLLILCFNLVQYVRDLPIDHVGDDWSMFVWTIELLNQITTYFEPFLYGALGSFVYLLRVTESRLPTREFDPIRAPEHINRLVLGTLSGGSIILFIEQPEIGSADENGIKIGAAALGFLAGYSIDFLFETLDRIIQAILPKVGLEGIPAKVRQKRDRELIQRYKKMLSETKDEPQQKLLQDIIDRLETR